ncbi:MAG: glycosyltransferase family 9 protein [Pseudobdellovibrionaceae bacterium]
MNILAISLLRLGDLIQHKRILLQIKKKHPNATLHLLCYEEFANIKFYLEDIVDHFHFLNRSEISSYAKKDKNFNEASFVLKQLPDLFRCHFQWVYNLTHNRFSALLSGIFFEAQKKGLYFENNQFQDLSFPWLRYFNDAFSGEGKSVFSYVESLSQSLQLEEILNSNKKYAPVLQNESGPVVIQPLTSDLKKNWSLEKFVELSDRIRSELKLEVVFLCAPFEKEVLTKQLSSSQAIACLPLADATQFLKSARLLVTGDTSIKHIAADLGLPMVELVLGSSDKIKNQALTPFRNTVISLEPCHPCTHRQACYQASHLCSQDISVQQVFNQVQRSLNREFIIESTALKLEKSVWQAYLNKQSQSLCKVIFSLTTDLELESISITCEKLKELCTRFSNTSHNQVYVLQDLQNFLQQTTPYDSGFYSNRLKLYLNSLKESQKLDFFKVHQALLEIKNLILIKEKLIEELTNERRIARKNEGDHTLV